MLSSTILYVFIGFISLIFILWFAHVSRKNTSLQETKLQISLLQERIDNLNHTIVQTKEGNHLQLLEIKQDRDQLKNQVLRYQEECSNLKSNLVKVQTEHQQAQIAYDEKLSLLDDAKHKLALEFKFLANEIFEEKQQKMTSSSKETLANIIEPMQKNMAAFRERIDKVHEEDVRARGSLERHLEHLQNLNQKMSQEALNLTHALKGDSKAQGNWGEMILERLLESSGLREGHEFEREKSFKNQEGKSQRPDVIVNMPDHKQVIIDSKVSLTDYERAISSDDEASKTKHIRAHVKSMQQHIQTLATKRYDQLQGINSPEYTLMFVPIESAYLMAVEADRSVFENAFHQRVAVVTPSTLYATLKLIEQLWRYEKQGENVIKLTQQAGRLHDKFVGFIESFEDINKHLSSAQKSYDTALGQLKNGKGNLINRVKTLADLSGKAQKEIPSHLLPQDEDANEDSNENINQDAIEATDDSASTT